MTEEELKDRTKRFAVEIIKFAKQVPVCRDNDSIVKQIIRSAGSVGANYRAACRGKSRKDFKYKINIVEEEADETLYWLELMEETIVADKEHLKRLMKEANELTAIFTAIGRTMNNRSAIKVKRFVNGQPV